MKNFSGYLLILLILTGCASTPKAPVQSFSLLEKSSNLTGENLSIYDMAYLDKSQFLIKLEGAQGKPSPNKKIGLIFINETFKQTPINLTSIKLKSWITKSLQSRGFSLESVSSTTQVVVLVEYGVENINNSVYEKQFAGKMQNRYLNLRALNYPAFKKNKTVQVLWEARVSSVGPERDMDRILPILTALAPEVLNKTASQVFLVAPNDPRLQITKDVPSAISLEYFKPTVEELKFFN